MLDKNTTGLIVGAFMGLVHLLWAILVALGLAQVLMDWIYVLHFLNNPFMVSGFNVVTAGLLVIVTGVCGYFFGWVFAFLWNLAKKNKDANNN